MPIKGQTKKRANNEKRYCSEYCLINYPDDVIKLNVPLGTAPESLIREFGLARTLRQFRPFRPEVDALIIRNDDLVLIETKIIRVLDGLAKLIVYRQLIGYTPELADYWDYPIKTVLVTPKPPLWFIKVAHDFDIDYVVYAPEWLDAYYKKQDEYTTKKEVIARRKRVHILEDLGFDEDV